jgi:hypothetical protein
MIIKMKKISLLALLALINNLLYSQDENQVEETTIYNSKGFNIGLNIGAYFPNKYTANLYDGYGFDIDGNRNTFENSFMYRKIILEYGGGYGQTDFIAQELNVAHNEWSFTESDMPVNMRYNPSFLVGLLGRYSVDKRNAILINVNASKINISGNFTITTNISTPINQVPRNIQTFAIRGSEQRLLLQFGYQHLFGENEKFNFFAEGGLNVSIAKFDKNEILINNLLIDLAESYNVAGNPSYVTRRPIGTGYGAFAGMGLNIGISEGIRVQIAYSPTLENINIVKNPKLKIQHSAGLRAYYNF